MTMQLKCPYCGARDETEFRYGGAAHVSRPDPDGASDAEWTAYLFERANDRGWFAERWCHSFGCRQWFNVLRNTITHEIRATYLITEKRPELCS